MSKVLVEGVEFIEVSAGVNGRLRYCYQFLKTVVDAPQFVLNILSQGYKLPFTDIPVTFYRQNNRSTRDHVSISINLSLNISSSGKTCIRMEFRIPAVTT